MERPPLYQIEKNSSFQDNSAAQASPFLKEFEHLRFEASRRISRDRQEEMGQFFTPSHVAQLMADMLTVDAPEIRLLDAGAGIGSLFAASVAMFCQAPRRPDAIRVTAYETEPLFQDYLAAVGALCQKECERVCIHFTLDIRQKDFIEDAVQSICADSLFQSPERFTCAILNPPYQKIHSASSSRQLLRQVGIETSNLYTAFLALAMRLLSPDGELVAITPRSFCNGTYFRPFRKLLLETMELRRIHIFESREEAFRKDAVLQETIIVHAVKSRSQPQSVVVTTSTGMEEDAMLYAEHSYESIVQPGDPEQFIRVVSDDMELRIGEQMARFETTLPELKLTVSTGRVVDFRAAAFLRDQWETETAPLLYPTNLEDGAVKWPVKTRKPQALVVCKETELLFVPNETYVLVKRFSAKEEKRRLVASVYEGGQLPGATIGFENHLNYFHANGKGLDGSLARGLALYLNSTLADTYFRQFSGHTQVNATDLRNMTYPTADQLRQLARRTDTLSLTQDAIDTFIRQEFFSMSPDGSEDPIQAKKRVEEAQAILKQLDLPKSQCNERSALTLLALLDLKPNDSWQDAANPPRGIHSILEFMKQSYGKQYAENTRETIRRQTIHQFLDAGLVLSNTDQPDRPTNSGKFAYHISSDALDLIRTFRTSEWNSNLSAYLASSFTLRERYAQERYLARIPVEIPSAGSLTLSPGGQNVLVKDIIEQFAPRFTPGARVLYIGDTDTKFAYFEKAGLEALGIVIEEHGKMPDVIIHHTAKNWLVLIEAVTSHGPINPKRKLELEKLFSNSTLGLVFVTAFLTRQAMRAYLPEIAWETDVWAADTADHLIHFNGERFLGPY